MIFYSVRISKGGVDQASIKTSPINAPKNFTSHDIVEITRISNDSTPIVYVKSGLEQITSQRCAKENGIPPPPPLPPLQGNWTISHSCGYRSWHPSETEEEAGGAKYLVLVLMKALQWWGQCQQLRCPRRTEWKSYSRGVCTTEPQPERNSM